MIQLDLNHEEVDVLVESLESFLSDLRMEICDTDLMDYREKLKRKKAALIKAVEGLKAEQLASS